MKVKIGEKIYNSDEEPIMLILEKFEKEHISEMSDDNKKYCVYPDKEEYTEDDFKKIIDWMKSIR